MRSALLSAVSHDLRRPRRRSPARRAPCGRRRRRPYPRRSGEGLLESIADEAERLERRGPLTNLLDMTRLANGAVALKRTWVPLEEMVGSALDRLESRLGARREIAFDFVGRPALARGRSRGLRAGLW